MLHASFCDIFFVLLVFFFSGLFSAPRTALFVLGWPSGPRRLTQVQVSTDAWVRIPLQAYVAFVLSFLCLQNRVCLGRCNAGVHLPQGPLV